MKRIKGKKKVERVKKIKMFSWNDLKLFSEQELEEMTSDYYFKTKPWTHQRATFLACMANPGFLSALDLGTGKTKVAIDVCRNLFGVKGKILVICLNSAVENWEDEVRIHSDMEASCLRGKDVDGRFGKVSKTGFSITHYEGIRTLVTKKKKVRDGKKKLVIDERGFKRLLSERWDAIIIDESHLVKESKTLNFKIARRLANAIDTKLLLTGTPFGNTLLDVWGQYFIMDKGETFDSSFGRFKNAYFKDVGYFGPKWEVTLTGKRMIEAKLFTKAIRYREDEVDELPEKVYRTMKFKLSTQQRKEYDALLKQEETYANTGVVSAANAYRQICSGFILKTKYEFKKNPKLDLLADLLDTVVSDHKVLIFYEFTHEFEMIKKRLKKLKIPFQFLNGMQKDAHTAIKSFNLDPKYRVMLAHPKSGGASINLTSATYCVFFSNGNSVISKKQCLKRIHRAGQLHRCFFIDLIAQSTVEVSMKRDLDNGMNAFGSIVDNKSYKGYLKGE